MDILIKTTEKKNVFCCRARGYKVHADVNAGKIFDDQGVVRISLRRSSHCGICKTGTCKNP